MPSTGFVATRWSQVARSAGDGSEARAALAWLCEAYWEPLRRFAERRGLDHHDAQDAVQSFFARLIERGIAAEADPAKGRFRTFLLAVFSCQLAHERDRGRARKRGGGRPDAALDPDLVISAPSADPDFDRDWAQAVLARAMERLASEHADARRRAVFSALRPFLAGDADAAAYAAAGAPLGMSEGAVKVAVHRLRQRFRAALRAEIAETVADPERPGAIDEEIGTLIGALSAGQPERL
jgi:RNA polymerase sigma factor (sigma-70 family)